MKIVLDGDEIKLYDFTLLQAYKIAKHLEEQGIEFYEKMLHDARDNDLKEGLRFLLSEEKEHLALFNNKIEELAKVSEDDFEEDDIAAYLDSRVFAPFSDNEEVKKIVKDRKKALGFGKIIEKRSISFYETCVKNTEELEAKRAFEALREAEKEHLHKLEGLMAK